MNRKLSLFLLAICVFSIAPTFASAASGQSSSRYFVATNRTFWKSAMNARHIFADGFTADLSDMQLRLAKLAGLKPIAVKKFYILADTSSGSVPTPQVAPSQDIPWGVRSLLQIGGSSKTHGGDGVSIAVLDTGVDREHADLKRRIDGCFDLSDSSKGFVDGECADRNGHGTHVAGVIAADGGTNSSGIFGFAPQASISAYRVCNASGICYSDDIAVAINHAVDTGTNIIVLSLGGESASSMIQDALSYAAENDVLVIAPAGNDGPYEESLDWPARDAHVVSVGAIDDQNEPAEFSSRGLNEKSESYVRETGDVEFAAPGVNIESTYKDGGYAIVSGTSMAAAHVAGLATVLWQKNARHPAQATRTLLHELSHDIYRIGDDAATGWGVPRVSDK